MCSLRSAVHLHPMQLSLRHLVMQLSHSDKCCHGRYKRCAFARVDYTLNQMAALPCLIYGSSWDSLTRRLSVRELLYYLSAFWLVWYGLQQQKMSQIFSCLK